MRRVWPAMPSDSPAVPVTSPAPSSTAVFISPALDNNRFWDLMQVGGYRPRFRPHRGENCMTFVSLCSRAGWRYSVLTPIQPALRCAGDRAVSDRLSLVLVVQMTAVMVLEPSPCSVVNISGADRPLRRINAFACAKTGYGSPASSGSSVLHVKFEQSSPLGPSPSSRCRVPC